MLSPLSLELSHPKPEADPSALAQLFNRSLS